MQWSTDIRQMKAAIWNKAFVGRTSVSCPIGRVVGIRRRKGQLQAMIFGWGRWYPVEDMLIVAGAPPILAQPVVGWHSTHIAVVALTGSGLKAA